MHTWQEIVHHTAFRYLDQTNINLFQNQSFTALSSFAMDDALAQSVSEGMSVPAIRLWTHPDTVVLGIPDARLPHIEDGVQFLHASKFQAVVRNSGGLAVVLDQGVLNISLVLPNVKHLSIHDCYEAMVRFIQHMLHDITTEIRAFEVVGSYCPGDYDLSIGGKKFAGISQRRVKDGAAIQIYLDVEGSGYERAELIQKFYKISLQGKKTRFTYPDINPATMASLSELLGIQLTVDDMKQRVQSTLKEWTDEITAADLTEAELAIYIKRLEQMHKRNEFIMAIK